MKENGAIIEGSTYFDTLLKEKSIANSARVCDNSNGIRFGQVFSTNLLMETGKLIGRIVGGVLGGTGMNLSFNEIFGKTTKIDELIEEGIYGEIPSWLIRLFRWVFI